MGNDSRRQVIKISPYRLYPRLYRRREDISSFAPDSGHAVQKKQGRDKKSISANSAPFQCIPSPSQKLEILDQKHHES
jgi:hypothetical protein